MVTYSLTQWLLIFYLYCFAGWIWECCYVSVRKGKWVNRGFLHGPLLPIYGSGAVVVLVSTLPVRTSIPLIYLFGTVSATILEFCTGFCMEKMFGVRYWDYSHKPFNVWGHICLGVSLGWGVFAVLMVRFVHMPVEKMILAIPTTVTDILALLITIGTAVDFTQSFNEAMDLKVMLEKISASKEQILMLAKRIEVAYAFAEDDYRQYRQRKIGEKAAKRQARSRWDVFEENLKAKRDYTVEKLQSLSEQASAYFSSHSNASDDRESTLQQFLTRLEEQKLQIGARTDHEFKRLSRIIRRNPGAVSMLHKEELEEIKDMMEHKNDE